MIASPLALEKLRSGNDRYIAGKQILHLTSDSIHRDKLIEEQRPFAAILGCSDSRVPVEIIFDQGLGDLFVIRVAGNIVAPSQIGSIEFAAEMFGLQLVVVLGHTRCGAIAATIDKLLDPQQNTSHNLDAIVNRITPAVSTLLASDLKNDRAALVKQATRANIRASVLQLKSGSIIIESLINQKKLLVVGAEYSIESGQVEFLDI